MAKRVKVVLSHNLAFWENLIDTVEDEPKRYLKRGEKVVIINPTPVYGGRYGDREYYRVNHPVHGAGYILTKGVDLDVDRDA